MALIERIPVRWRIAITTAGLTFLILLAFAFVLGNLVGDRIRDDFDEELRSAAGTLAEETRIGIDPQSEVPVIQGPRLSDSAMADHAVIRIVDQFGEPLATSDASANLGPPSPGITDSGSFSVASEPIATTGSVTAFVQYGEPDDNVEASINRLWFFLGTGVLAGTILALIAGLAVAHRAMRPISSLTALARDIADTRDPSRRMPVPAADDEIGELAETMDGMLKALDEARTERERAFERQREFVADASHELRTPLTSVQANLELLRDSLGSASLEDPDNRHAVESALGSTRRMSRLVSDLLLLARADTGRRSARTDVDLAEVGSAALQEAEPLVGERTVTTELRGPLLVEGNPDELHRLVLNLVENALRHTPEKAMVSVSAETKEGHEGWAILEVADDGAGIPADLGDQVFQRFVRGEGPADTSAGGGSGLGLAIVRAVAESHGGSVEAGKSKTGGARFTVELPLANAQTRVLDSEEDETEPAEASTPLSRRPSG
jgi:signal transduction histidine kinase